MLRRKFWIATLFIGAAFAQTPQDELRSGIRAVRYPTLAEFARVHGDVHLSLKSGVVTLSGPPLLAKTAIDSAKEFASIRDGADLDVAYHFIIADTVTSVPTQTAVKRGNAFERVVLRMFGLKTEKVVLDYQCQGGTAPPNHPSISGSTIEVWIYGTTHCLTTETGTLIARR
jgi:hypothetical protein